MNPKAFVGLYVGFVTVTLMWFLYVVGGIHNKWQLFLFGWTIFTGYMPILIVLHGLDLFGFRTKLNTMLKKINRKL